MSTSKDIEDSLRHTLNRDSHDISLPLSDDLFEQVDEVRYQTVGQFKFRVGKRWN